MPPKRKDPATEETPEEAVAREAARKAAQNLRKQRSRARARIQRDKGLANRPQRTIGQLATGEQIISFTDTEAEQVNPTLLQVGLRVQGYTLPQDPVSAQQQQDGVDVDNHEALYSAIGPDATIQPNALQPSQSQSQAGPSQAGPSQASGSISSHDHLIHNPLNSPSRNPSIRPLGAPALQRRTPSQSPSRTPSRASQRTPSLPASQRRISNYFTSTPTRNPLTQTNTVRAITPSPLRASNIPPTSPSTEDNPLHLLESTSENDGAPSSGPRPPPTPTLLHAVIPPFADNTYLATDATIARDPSSSSPQPTVDQTASLLDHNLPTEQAVLGDNSTRNTTISNAEEQRRSHTLEDDVQSAAGRIDQAVEDWATQARNATIEDDEEDETPIEFTARMLFEQLQGGFHGCTKEQHASQDEPHIAHVAAGQHFGLESISQDVDFPSVLAQKELLTSSQYGRQQRPTPAQWQAMFCGVPTQEDRDTPIDICLHEADLKIIEPEVAYDIDSFLGFATSLSIARKGLWYQPAPQFQQNLKTDIHIKSTTYTHSDDPDSPARARRAMLKDIPHFLLGRLEGAHDISLFVLFPHLPTAGDKFNALTQEQLRRWTDLIYLPAIQKFYRAHYTQHMPSSFRNALANSKAYQVEQRATALAGYRTQQSIGYHLQPEQLADIWEEVLETINNTDGLHDFREPEIFFTSKGTKLQFKTGPSKPTLLYAMDYFQSWLSEVVNLDYLGADRFYVDIGKEICASHSALVGQDVLANRESHVYLWKRCCLERYMKWMYEGKPPSKDSQGQQYFTQNMLYDAGSLTSVSPKKSKQRQGGLIYTQFYSSVKEIYDASKCFPFTNDNMEEMVLDSQIRNAANTMTGGTHRDIRVVETAYLASKRRANQALRDSENKSYGLREEHRIDWALFSELQELLRSSQLTDPPSIGQTPPPYAWAIRTSTYLNFLWRSADKFATGFEVIRALSTTRKHTTWEESKMMAMFLRCLRYVFGGHLLSRESALWWSERNAKQVDPDLPIRKWYGLGFRITLPRYKYCWIEPRIDWSSLQFRSEYSSGMLFMNDILRGRYLRRGAQLKDFFDRSRQMDLALEWLGKHHSKSSILPTLISWLAHLCLLQFRIDVLQFVKKDIIEARRNEALKGDKCFSYEYLSEIMISGCYLMSGNKTDFKQPDILVRYLFARDDGLDRLFWDQRSFRVLYYRAKNTIAAGADGQNLSRLFTGRVLKLLYRHHWILPYPCSNALLQTTKQGATYVVLS